MNVIYDETTTFQNLRLQEIEEVAEDSPCSNERIEEVPQIDL